jgi:hypothetical protein
VETISFLIDLASIPIHFPHYLLWKTKENKPSEKTPKRMKAGLRRNGINAKACWSTTAKTSFAND